MGNNHQSNNPSRGLMKLIPRFSQRDMSDKSISNTLEMTDSDMSEILSCKSENRGLFKLIPRLSRRDLSTTSSLGNKNNISVKNKSETSKEKSHKVGKSEDFHAIFFR